MIWRHKIDNMSEDELHILGHIFKDLLTDQESVSGSSTPLYRLCWLRPEIALNKIKQSQELVVDEHKPLIDSIIQKLIL